MKLSQLLHAIGASCTQEAEITALTCDSREAAPGALFVAMEGANTDGRSHIPEALERGAAAVVCRPPLSEDVPGAPVEDPRAALALLAAEFYGHPEKSLTLIAITGTKGKTTTAHMLRDILTASGRKTGMIGTLGSYIGRQKLSDGLNTTPEPIALHQTLRQMAGAGCSHVVMEVSSQAMKLKRVHGLAFAAGLFLNLSPDHIGGAEHADFDEYRACKAALFRQCAAAVGNADDPAWPAMAAQIPAGAPVLTFGFGKGADVRAVSAAPDPDHPLSTLLTVEGVNSYSIPLPGRFNVANALAAAALSRVLGVPDAAVRAGLSRVSVPGRAQIVPVPAPFTVVIDYAHNGSSFDAILSALAKHRPSRILLVFGAGGDRPRIRRTDMARSAARWADYAVLTADNPRSERVWDICADIAAALGDAIPWEIVPDRREAIFRALSLAGEGDVVALLGKGHEEYIEENGIRRPFSERAVVEEMLSAHEAAAKEVTDGLDQRAAALEGVKLAHNGLS